MKYLFILFLSVPLFSFSQEIRYRAKYLTVTKVDNMKVVEAPRPVSVGVSLDLDRQRITVYCKNAKTFTIISEMNLSRSKNKEYYVRDQDGTRCNIYFITDPSSPYTLGVADSETKMIIQYSDQEIEYDMESN